MPSSKIELLRRQEAVNKTLTKFRGRGFDWKAGHTCVHLARFHLRQMGHKPEPIPAFRSEIGALRALKERGCSSVADLLDAQPGLMRVQPAAMRLGDLATVEGAEGVGTVMLCLSAHKLAGWHEDADGMIVLDVSLADISAAWRV